MPRFVALLIALLIVASGVVDGERSARAEATSCADAAAGLCADEPLRSAASSDAGARPPSAAFELVFFWGVGCPHCEEAKPFVDALERERPELRVVRVESRSDAAGRRRFVDTMNGLGASAVGVPTFVVGERYVTGFVKGETEAKVRALVDGRRRELDGRGDASPAETRIRLPLLGEVDPKSVSLPLLTVAVGLADGVNPCAMWVLVVLLGILMHVRETKRMLLYAGTFVVMSGLVYFVFMVAWSTLFELLGFSRGALTAALTAALGASVLVGPLVITQHSHPFGLSSYVPLVGGAPGAADLGLNRQFWGFTTQSLDPWLRAHAPANASVYIHDTAWDSWLRMLDERRIRPDLRGVGSPSESDFAIVHHELHMAEVDYNIWADYGHVAPAYVLTHDGVPIVSLHQRALPPPPTR